jgi:LPXTG-site transpeptidase (sortase) family protein
VEALLREKVGRPGRPGWWAVALFIVQLALIGGVSVVLVACVLLGALWRREGSPNPFAYLLKGDQRPQTVLSASEPRREELTPTLFSAAPSPSEVEDSSLIPSEAQPPEAGMAISTHEATPSDQGSPSLRQPFEGAQDTPSPGGPVVGQALTGLVASLPDRPATRIVIPAIDVDAPVVVIPIRNGTWDVEQITHEVGHLQGTASPGDSSNVVLAGHITLTAGGYGPFRGLSQLQPGDEVLVYVGDQEVYVYKVDSVKTVEATDVEVAYPTAEPILTLITCVNWDPVQGRYNDRLVVVAHFGG